MIITIIVIAVICNQYIIMSWNDHNLSWLCITLLLWSSVHVQLISQAMHYLILTPWSLYSYSRLHSNVVHGVSLDFVYSILNLWFSPKSSQRGKSSTWYFEGYLIGILIMMWHMRNHNNPLDILQLVVLVLPCVYDIVL